MRRMRGVVRVIAVVCVILMARVRTYAMAMQIHTGGGAGRNARVTGEGICRHGDYETGLSRSRSTGKGRREVYVSTMGRSNE